MGLSTLETSSTVYSHGKVQDRMQEGKENKLSSCHEIKLEEGRKRIRRGSRRDRGGQGRWEKVELVLFSWGSSLLN